MLRIGPPAVLGLYTFSYVLAASLIRRNFLSDRVTGAYTWVIALVLLGITTTIIPLRSLLPVRKVGGELAGC